jgi:hypothetical protein
MKITKELLKQVVTETLKRTGHITEAYAMEKDFKKGMPVSWNTLEKVIKKTASGREKVDYERVSNKGFIMDMITAPAGHNEPGLAVVKDLDGKSHEVALTELTPA